MQPERNRSRWHLCAVRVFIEVHAVPRPATSASTIPVETVAPPITNILIMHVLPSDKREAGGCFGPPFVISGFKEAKHAIFAG